MEKATREQMLDYVNEVANTYNSTNRASKVIPATEDKPESSGGCYYFFEGTQGCAIGRRIPDKELCKTLDKQDATGVGNNAVYNLLPDNLKIYTKSFLSDIQSLHDYAENWIPTGLSVMGTKNVERLKERIMDEKYAPYFNFNIQ